MIHVKNRRAVANLSRKSLKANLSRNLVSIAAVSLTTLLFVALITIAFSINDAFQDSNFRQAGGYSHGSFKYLTQEQYNELITDEGIKEYGLRRFLGTPKEAPFNKCHVEIGFSDANHSRWSYCEPAEGKLPGENTNEAAADTRVLNLLGIEPEPGSVFSLSFPVDGKETTQTFTLCGWWEYDAASPGSFVLIPESRVNTILNELGLDPEKTTNREGRWNLDVMFSSSVNIERQINDVLLRHGYQSGGFAEGENFISTGVNWGYTTSQITAHIDAGTAAAVLLLLAVIILTGYLIIYNVFRISVVNDIRFYGMLKTIGTTPRQLRHIVRRQAVTLCIAGIPAGLIAGWITGYVLTPFVLLRMNAINTDTVSVNPLIFLFASMFSLITVLFSCAKPASLAGRVSPIEALRYTEGSGRGKTRRSSGVSVFAMAWANLERSRSKTIVTILSLSLSVLLLTMTVTFTNGFDMDKYLADKVSADYVFARAEYFQTSTAYEALVQSEVDEIASLDGIAEGGAVYAGSWAREPVTEEYYRNFYSRWNNSSTIDLMVNLADKTSGGQILTSADLYGMEEFALSKLKVVEGNLSDIGNPLSNTIAAVYYEDDYGNIIPGSHWAKPGDTVTITYVDDFEYVSLETGEIVDPESGEGYKAAVTASHDVTYTVTAAVIVPSSLSYRYYGSDQFVLGADTLIRDDPGCEIMLYAFDAVDEKAGSAINSFLADYTSKVNPLCSYENSSVYVEEFNGFRNMFLLLGGALSFIVGLVGILNFFNAVLTGILARRRELAMLQSIGMTGRQMKSMLVYEGTLYALGSPLFSLVLTLLAGPLLARALEKMFWFYSNNLTLMPIALVLPVFLLLGIILPLVCYRSISRQTIVERLRETE